jgi:two-component system sensor kinase FixL
MAYVVAVALVLVTLWARVHWEQYFDGPTFIVFTVPIILAAYWGGLWAGLVATFVTILGADYYLLPPLHNFAVASHFQQRQEAMLVIAGTVISLICEGLHRARQRAERAAAAAERGGMDAARLAAIVASSQDAIIGKDLNGIVTSWNEASKLLFGYTALEMIGTSISRLIPSALLAEEDQIIRQLKAGGTIEHYETTRLRKDGTEITVSLSISPVRNSQGRIVGAAKIARDITDKKKIEAHLRVLQTELAHGARLSAMGQMSAALAHELNQPLTAIMNYVKAAQRMLEPHALTREKQIAAREAMEKAAGQTLRAGSIIKRLRDFVEKRESERRVENLNEIVEEAIALGLIGTADGSVRVELALSEAVLPVRIDRIQIQQVLLNLIRNATEAMSASPTRVLTLSTEKQAAFGVITVRDTGPGLPPDILSRLFQPFITTKTKGMGIGLTICQSIIEAHGGTIGASNDVDGGALFRISLPLEVPD